MLRIFFKYNSVGTTIHPPLATSTILTPVLNHLSIATWLRPQGCPTSSFMYLRCTKAMNSFTCHSSFLTYIVRLCLATVNTTPRCSSSYGSSNVTFHLSLNSIRPQVISQQTWSCKVKLHKLHQHQLDASHPRIPQMPHIILLWTLPNLLAIEHISLVVPSHHHPHST